LTTGSEGELHSDPHSTPAPPEAWQQLEGLLEERLRKCVALVPKVLGDDDPEGVHDLRVWTRRLQQVIVTLFPEEQPPQARVMIKTLRRARRALGGWRDCDVVLAALNRKIRRIRSVEQKQAWEVVRQYVQHKLHREMRRAREKLANRKVFTLAHSGRELMEQKSNAHLAPENDPLGVLRKSISVAFARWHEELERARSSFNPTEVHAFRIQSKRLRYCIELLRDLGSPTAKKALSALKTLQDELGHWHDHVAFTALTVEALAHPEFLIQNPKPAAEILRRLARDNSSHLNRVHQMLTNMGEESDPSPIFASIAKVCDQSANGSGSSGSQSEHSATSKP